ncbi:clavesin-1 [Trichonephila inaurata madagascariensis]|uniref:Clavesin-1 n=1 Tax=Trichonephila inaurata madagascariensis TaxID=2747483 RepID=A0A8X6Y3M5_9ARAC|nr:clavesin-1 [Trichonephila inaurata madagascariensis]
MDTAQRVREGKSIYRPLLDTTLTKEDIRKAKQELNEKPEDLNRHLVRVKELLTKEKELFPNTDDEFLHRFLRARKFNDERAANLIRDHYRYRVKHPRLFRRPKDMEAILRCNIFNYLAHRDAQGRAIFVMKIGHWCPETFSFKEFVGAGNVLSQWVLSNPVTQINGYVGIWDFKDYSFQHFSNSCTPRLMWMLSSLMQVVVIGSDMKDLHKYIHASVLPEEYGGTMPPSDCTEAVNRLLEADSEWIKDKKYGYVPKIGRCKEEEEEPELVKAAKEESCAA